MLKHFRNSGWADASQLAGQGGPVCSGLAQNDPRVRSGHSPLGESGHALTSDHWPWVTLSTSSCLSPTWASRGSGLLPSSQGLVRTDSG